MPDEFTYVPLVQASTGAAVVTVALAVVGVVAAIGAFAVTVTVVLGGFVVEVVVEVVVVDVELVVVATVVTKSAGASGWTATRLVSVRSWVSDEPSPSHPANASATAPAVSMYRHSRRILHLRQVLFHVRLQTSANGSVDPLKEIAIYFTSSFAR